jgi:DNA-binding transcriptional LysR family regulator
MSGDRDSLIARKNLPMDVLRSLVTIVERGGFTQAGDALGRSQAAISLQIKKLEQMVGEPLFDRTSSTVKLTTTGELVMDYARQILTLNDRVLRELQQPAIEGRVRLGIPSEFATTLLPRIIGRFAAENPNVTLEVNCDLSRNLLAALDKGEYDLVLGLHRTPSEAGKNLIMTDDLVWVSGRDFAPKETQVALIAAPEGCIYRSSATNALNEKQINWKVIYTIPDLAGIRSALEEGLGITVLARSTVPRNLHAASKTGKLPGLGKIGISLIAAPGDAGAACQALQSHIKTALAERIQLADL